MANKHTPARQSGKSKSEADQARAQQQQDRTLSRGVAEANRKKTGEKKDNTGRDA
jgi:hypothetical protein